ncbi:MAG: serine hydrolase domain-containing protein [Pseudobdellovibrionaceae bacterium]
MRATCLLVALFLVIPALAFADNTALLQKIVQRAVESESDSLVIIQNGKVIYSNYFTEQDQVRSVQSITKSVCALAIGILLDQGKIESLDLPMSKWIPDWSEDSEKSRITLRMIMSHTSGLPDIDTIPDFWSQPDSVRAAISMPLIAHPGSQYLYSNIGATLLQPVIAQSSGRSVMAFVRDAIFSPLGITDFHWNKDKAGNEITSGGLFLSTADLLRIGSVLLGNGFFEGKSIIRASTLQILVSRSQPYFPYGFLFWLDQAPAPSNVGLFSALGWGGQYITVFPEKNLFAVRTKDPKTIVEARRAAQAFQDFRSLISQWE